MYVYIHISIHIYIYLHIYIYINLSIHWIGEFQNDPASRLVLPCFTPLNPGKPRYEESFGSDWEERWAPGPAELDENGKEIKRGLINAKLVKLHLE